MKGRSGGAGLLTSQDRRSPVAEVHIVASSEGPGGIGEVATAAVSHAVTNAICAAVGRRVRTLPINPDGLTKT